MEYNMKSAIFKLESRADDQAGISQILQEADVIFARDENGVATDGCGWNEVRRVDEDYIEIAIKTTDEIMDMVCQDPRLELVQQLEGWPEPEPEVEAEP
jgi:hypothetical protein